MRGGAIVKVFDMTAPNNYGDIQYCLEIIQIRGQAAITNNGALITIIEEIWNRCSQIYT